MGDTGCQPQTGHTPSKYLKALQIRVEHAEAEQAVRRRRIDALELELEHVARQYVDARQPLIDMQTALLKLGGRQ